MDNTPNLELPYLAAAQAQKHVTHNEAIRALDAIVQLSVLDRDVATPPLSPAEGDRYIIASGGTGDWAGHDGKVAAYQDGVWVIYGPQLGWITWIEDESMLAAWDGAAWLAAGGGDVNPAPLVGVNATADDTNRLSVKSDAVLFSHDDVTPGSGDMRNIMNKAAAANTASFLFQTNWSGRAEVGTTGDDNLSFKVSPDGTAWYVALLLDKADGGATFRKVMIESQAAGDKALHLKGALGQTADILLVELADGTDALRILASGAIHTLLPLVADGGFYPQGDVSFYNRILMRAAAADIWLGKSSAIEFHDADNATSGAQSSSLYLDAHNELGLRNGTSAQKLSVYETSDAGLANYSRAYIKAAAAGDVEIGTEAAGTGVRRDLKFNGPNRVAKVNDPSGGATVDAEARTAINAIIDALEAFGLSADI